MPIWGWLGFLALTTWYAFRVRRSWTTKKGAYGPFSYDAVSSPATFWFLMGVEAVILVFLATFIFLIVAHQLRAG